MSGLTWQLTDVWKPTDTELYCYGQIADPLEGEIDIPLNDSRTAKVTFSVHDTALAQAVQNRAYEICLKGYYRGVLIFWGAVNQIGGDLKEGTITLSAIDRSGPLLRHQLRRGDLAGGPRKYMMRPPDDRGAVSIDHIGLRLLRDAGMNTAEQTARDMPDLGIVDGTNDFVADPETLMGVDRGFQVWNAMVQLSQSRGPDFELEPVEDVVGAYAQLNTFITQGNDKTGSVQFHFGTGLSNNLENLTFAEGEQYVTHAHALDREGNYRFTESNTASSGETGAYVQWDATDFEAPLNSPYAAANAENVLRAFAQNVITAHSRPSMVFALTLPLETEDGYHYGTEQGSYAVGDIVDVAGKAGGLNFGADFPHRITRVTLKQEGEGLRPVLQVIPDRTLNDGLDGAEQ